ncbi:MAG: aerotolerance regulator BatA [Bacteroidetes bacterium GWF2_29_10]|nr:MAG: aerotolerance regulator BatA [Bacteroidetes bacterium GWF2_29_10]
MTFANPEYFLFLLLVPLFVYFRFFRKTKKQVAFNYPDVQELTKIKKSFKIRLIPSLDILRYLAIVFIIISLARPQTKLSRSETAIEGIDIVIALDISSSMLAEDFKPNRLEASKDVATQFIDGRNNDRVGLVVFSGESFTQCPLTTDKVVLKNLFSGIKCGMIEDGTAIGSGLATAVSRLRNSSAKSKVIILLTDGVNNRGVIAPSTAAEIARSMGVRVYTIGVGTYGMAPYPFQTPFGIQYQNVEVEIDEGILKEISKMTGGTYYRANNKNKLKEIYSEIDKLEKSKIEVTEFHRKKELFLTFLLIGFLFLVIEVILKYTYLKKLP